MALSFRLARPEDHPRLAQIVVDGFEQVTVQTFVDEHFGLLNGTDWRDRWRARFRHALETEVVMVGEASGEIASVIAGKVDPETRLGYVDILAVARDHHRHGYGRETLRWMLAHLKSLGAIHAHLDCLVTNVEANGLYESEGFVEAGRSVLWYIKIP